jgi:Ser/Thr protein kinase RdoA (MazF antagonist)
MEYVDAALRGYREHVQLTDEELDRLPGVLRMRPLWLLCGDFRFAARKGLTPNLDEGWGKALPERMDRLAAHATAFLRD